MGQVVPTKSAAPLSQDGGGAVVEVDAAATGAGLSTELDGTASDGLDGAVDREPTFALIEVAPLEPDDLAATHPGVGGEVQRRVQAVRLRGSEEGGELLDAPDPSDRHAATTTPGEWTANATFRSTRRRCTARSSALPHDEVDLVHGLRCQRTTVTTTAAEQLFVQAVEVLGSQGAERDVTEPRDEIVLGDPGVPVVRRCSDLNLLPRQPGVDEEPTERCQ